MPDGYHDNEFIKEVAEIASHYNGVVAGSAARSYRNPAYSYGDVDVFFLGTSDIAYTNQQTMLRKLMDEGWEVTAANVPGVWNAHRVACPPVQLVVPDKPATTVMLLIESFTLAAQQYALTYRAEPWGISLVKSYLATQDELWGSFTVAHWENPLKVVWSLGKYRGKGYHVTMHHFVKAMNTWAGLTQAERDNMVEHDPYDFADPVNIIGGPD